LLASWYVIGASTVLFALEFVADKIPGFDLVWNTVHTFVRVPIAALLAYRATDTLAPWEQMAAAAAGGAIALISHSGKTAARAAVTASPEPFSNIAQSLAGDGLSISLTWLATKHPYVAASIAVGLLAVTIFLVRWMVRWLKSLVGQAKHAFAG
jgi:xanthine/uracil permease